MKRWGVGTVCSGVVLCMLLTVGNDKVMMEITVQKGRELRRKNISTQRGCSNCDLVLNIPWIITVKTLKVQNVEGR